MTEKTIAIPKFAAEHVAGVRCRHCDRPLLPKNVVAAGIRRDPSSSLTFAVTIYCDRCKKRTPSYMPWRRLDHNFWAAQVAAATPTPQVIPPQQKLQPVETTVSKDTRSEDDGSKERPEFYALPVVVLNYTPGNYDHADGEPASILTFAKKDGTIEPLAFSTRDTKTLVTRALITLATYDDPLAQKLLDSHFQPDDDGNFGWPDDPSPGCG